MCGGCKREERESEEKDRRVSVQGLRGCACGVYACECVGVKEKRETDRGRGRESEAKERQVSIQRMTSEEFPCVMCVWRRERKSEERDGSQGSAESQYERTICVKEREEVKERVCVVRMSEGGRERETRGVPM